MVLERERHQALGSIGSVWYSDVVVQDRQTVPEEDNGVVAGDDPRDGDMVSVGGEEVSVVGVSVEQEEPGAVVGTLRAGGPPEWPHYTHQPPAVLQPH